MYYAAEQLLTAPDFEGRQTHRPQKWGLWQMGSTVLLAEIKHCRAPTSPQDGVKVLRQCLHRGTLHLFLIQMQYTENHFNESVQMQLGLYKRLEKMCVTAEKNNLKRL